MKRIGARELGSLVSKGAANLDDTRISDKTLIIPMYDSKSIYQDLVLNKQYDKLSSEEEKNKYYREIWNKGIQASSFKECSYKITDINFENLNNDDKKKHLFLSFYEKFGYRYAVIWYVDDNNEELPAAMVIINDVDLGNKNDLQFMFDIINHSILLNQELSKTKMYAQLKTKADGSSMRETKLLYSNQTKDEYYQDVKNEYYSALTANFMSEADYKTLLLPEDNRNKALDKVMADWTYSKYEYLPEEAIQEKRRNSDPNHYYLRMQTAGSGMMESTTVWILSTESNRILYQYLHRLSGKDRLVKVMPMLMKDIGDKVRKNDPSSTISYNRVEFKSSELPLDLKNSKIAYVNLTKDQCPYGSLLNGSFERLFKNYPYQYKITDNAKDISDCKYRVMLKSYTKTFTETGANLNSDRGAPSATTRTVTKELFYLYLKDLVTGECYKFQDEPDFYNKTFKNFIKTVK